MEWVHFSGKDWLLSRCKSLRLYCLARRLQRSTQARKRGAARRKVVALAGGAARATTSSRPPRF
jgi:hypothetical protein